MIVFDDSSQSPLAAEATAKGGFRTGPRGRGAVQLVLSLLFELLTAMFAGVATLVNNKSSLGAGVDADRGFVGAHVLTVDEHVGESARQVGGDGDDRGGGVDGRRASGSGEVQGVLVVGTRVEIDVNHSRAVFEPRLGLVNEAVGLGMPGFVSRRFFCGCHRC